MKLWLGRWAMILVAVSLFLGNQASAENVVLRPPAPTNRVAIFFHGSGGYAKNLINNPQVKSVADILLRRGFAVAASDADGPQNWGNPASVAANLHLIHRLNYKRVFLWGGSMGGLDTMQMIGPIHPEAVALVSPVCNIKGVPLIQAGVEMAWGDARPDYLSPVSAKPDPGLPVKIWASPEDTWVPKDRNADLCARELRRGGAIVNMKPTTGEHTNSHMLRPYAVPNFFSTVAAANR